MLWSEWYHLFAIRRLSKPQFQGLRILFLAFPAGPLHRILTLAPLLAFYLQLRSAKRLTVHLTLLVVHARASWACQWWETLCGRCDTGHDWVRVACPPRRCCG